MEKTLQLRSQGLKLNIDNQKELISKRAQLSSVRPERLVFSCEFPLHKSKPPMFVV